MHGKLILFFFIPTTFCNELILKQTYPYNHPGLYYPLAQVTYELYGRHEIFFDVILYGQFFYVNDTVNKYLQRSLGRFCGEIKQYDYVGYRRAIKIKNPAVIFVDSIFSLSYMEINFFKDAEFGNYKTMYFLVYIKSYYWPDFEKNFKDEVIPSDPNSDRGHISQFTYFLIDTYNTLVLKTFEWWTESECNKPQLVTLNIFDFKSYRWLNGSLKFPKKFTNFHGCKLRYRSKILRCHTLEIMKEIGGDAMEFHPRIPEAIKKRDKTDHLIVKIFAEKGNFSVELNENDPQFEQASDWFAEVECSIPLFAIPIVTMYTPPEPYNNYEKMILPFDTDTWMYLIIVFCSSFVGIFVINQLPRGLKDIVYGKNVKMPSFNVIGAIFGIGQTKLPDNDFGRIILIFFIIFCLIMRTAYQGVFFEMFTSDMRRRPPETYLDLKERNYTLYTVSLGYFSAMEYTDFVIQMIPENERPRIASDNFMNVFKLFRKMSDPSLKAAILTTENDVKLYRAAFTNVPNIISEIINPTPYSICVSWNNFFATLNREVSNEILTAGIPQYLFEFLLKFEMRPLLEPPQEPKVFDVEDLKFGFVVWLVACLVAIVIFILEIIYKVSSRYFYQWTRSHVGLILFYKLLRNRLKFYL